VDIEPAQYSASPQSTGSELAGNQELEWLLFIECGEKQQRNIGRIVSTSGETGKGCKTGSKDKRYVKYSVIGVRVVAAVDLTKIRENHMRGPVLGDGEDMLYVARARVSNAGMRQAGASNNVRAQCMSDAFFYSLR